MYICCMNNHVLDIMENQQGYNLTGNQIQLLLTGTFGDGSIVKTSSGNYYYQTNGIKKDYIEFKKSLMGDLETGIVKESINCGFKKAPIYSVHSKYDRRITDLHLQDVKTKLNLLDELGMALWLYDDGSLHYINHFYNLNTQSFSQEVQEDLFIPFLRERFNIIAKCTKETKKDGRVFHYLRISRHAGAYEINKILQKYPVEGFRYKMWSSETIQKWSKVQAYLKRQDRELTPRLVGDYMKKENFL